LEETLHLQQIGKMDLNSLLNANFSAAGQRKDVTRSPPRNRTPWDAGGYSLPINTVSSMTGTSPTTPPQNNHLDDSHIDTPRSPHHKFSDSRSSLSSFTSSLQSASHSRFSSMSTVSSAIQPLNTILAESIGLDSATKPKSLNLETLASMDHHYSHSRSSSSATQPQDSISPTDSLDALALVTESQLARREFEPSTLKTGEDNMSLSKEGQRRVVLDKSISPKRPCSPSDAILIKRTTVPILRVNTGEQDLAEPSHLQL
jgi:hypothetical protein